MLPDLSRSRAKSLIEGGEVRVDGQIRSSPSARLVPGQQVEVTVPEPEAMSLLPEDLDLEILYQDADLVVVNKRAGMVVHPSKGHDTGTLVHGLLHAVDDLSGIGGVERPGIVHRLDKGTSGVMVVAKNDRAHQHLKEQFSAHTAEREYRALVLGAPELDAGTVEGWLGRRDNDRLRFAPVEEGKGRWARTHWSVVERLHRSTLMACRLETGRTHQVRVHMSSQGWPLLGDPLYRDRQTPPPAVQGLIQDLDHQLLHARVLGFSHPSTGERMRFESELPADFQAVLQGLRAL